MSDFENMSDEEFEQYANDNPISDEELDALDKDFEKEEADIAPTEEPEEVIEEDEEVEEPEEELEVLEDTDPEEETEDVTEDTEEDTPETLDTEEETGEENTQDTEEVDDYDYKTEFSTLMAPIKANGQEIQIKSPEDARTLIQKGLNYDEKMVSIKPVRLAGKALERAGIIKDGIIDEVALNRMIDFNNGNVEVVKERLKELEIDPLDLDLDATNYQAQDHMVSEHSVVLDDVQRELDNRGTTDQVISALNSLDTGSKTFFSDNPEQLLGLEQDVANGVFDEINSNVQYERRMGRLAGKTDMEAYIEFAQARAQQVQTQQVEPERPTTPTKKVNTAKRAKAAGSKPAVGKTSEAVNPFDLSDEEFEAQFGTQQALR